MAIKNNECKDQRCSPSEKKLMWIFEKGLQLVLYLLIIIIFIIIIRQFYLLLGVHLFSDIKTSIDIVLFIFILIELIIILFEYITKGNIKVENIVEVGIISVVREVMFHSLDMDPFRMLSFAAILLVFGGIFYIEKKLKFIKGNDNSR